MFADGITSTNSVLTGLTLGITYELTVEARNSLGYSSPSETLSFLHALVPETPDAPTTANSGQDIIITWTAPSDNGSALLSYQIKFV